MASVNGDPLAGRAFKPEENGGRREDARRRQQGVARIDEAQQRLGLRAALRAEAVHGGVRHLIEDDRRPEVGRGRFEPNVVKREAAHVTGIYAIGGRRSYFKILAGDLGNFTGGFLRGAAAFVDDVNVLKADLFQEFILDAVDDDARSRLARTKFLRPRQVFVLPPLSHYCGPDAVEGDVANHAAGSNQGRWKSGRSHSSTSRSRT